MRIVGGDLRGRRLETPKDEAIRPTSDMVKEAVFNIIQFEITGRRALDLFCGTGQMGLEAISRGAERCVFVDESNDALALSRRNIARCKAEDKSEVVRADAFAFVERRGMYDIIFLDPPYDGGISDKILRKIIEIDILRENGIIICETRAEHTTPDVPPPYYLRREYRYSKVKIAVFDKLSHKDG